MAKYHLYGTKRDGTNVDLGHAYGTKAHANSRLAGEHKAKDLVQGEAWLVTETPGSLNESCAIRKEWK
jgi:hypothetical protein